MYTLKILPGSQYEKLPYKHTEDSFGLADYKNKKAYVRESGIPALDVLNAGHEIQEMLADISPHEIDGIRYKSGGGILQMVLPLALGLVTGGLGAAGFLGGSSGLLGGIGSALSSSWAPAVVGAGAGAALNPKNPLGGAISGGLGGYGGGLLGGGAVTGFSSAAGQGFGNQLAAAGKGAIFGTGGNASTGQYSLLNASKTGSTGLLGPGTMLGSMNPTARSAATTLGTNAASQMLSGGQSQAAPTFNVYAPSTGFNSGLAAPQSIQSIRTTPSLSGFAGSQSVNNPNGFNNVLPGFRRQSSIYTWA